MTRKRFLAWVGVLALLYGAAIGSIWRVSVMASSGTKWQGSGMDKTGIPYDISLDVTQAKYQRLYVGQVGSESGAATANVIDSGAGTAPALFGLGGINQEVATQIIGIIETVYCGQEKSVALTAKEFSNYAQNIPDNHYSKEPEKPKSGPSTSGAIYVRLFDRWTGGTSDQNSFTGNASIGARWWKLVYCQNNIATFYMSEAYASSEFNTNYPGGGDTYNNSTVRAKVLADFAQVTNHYPASVVAFAGAQEWQSEQFEGNGYVYAGTARNYRSPAVVATDKCWLPSNLEIIRDFRNGNEGGTGVVTSQIVRTSGNLNNVLRTGLFKMNGYDRGFDASARTGVTIPNAWTRSADILADSVKYPTTATVQYDAAAVDYLDARCNVVEAVRPCVNVDLTKLLSSVVRHTVTFDAGAGTGELDSQDIVEGFKAHEPDVSGLVAPSEKRFGHEWVTSGGDVWDFATGKVTGDMTLFARYIDDEIYTIKFDANGGLGKMTSQRYVQFEAQALKANAFTRAYNVHFEVAGGEEVAQHEPVVYEMTGWNTEADGTGEAFEVGHEFLFESEPEFETLYAQWEVVIEAGRNLPETTKDGHKFLYWTENEDGSGARYEAGAEYPVPSGDVAYFAQWEKVVVTEQKPEEKTETGEEEEDDDFVGGERGKFPWWILLVVYFVLNVAVVSIMLDKRCGIMVELGHGKKNRLHKDA